MNKDFYELFKGGYCQTFDDTGKNRASMVRIFPMQELDKNSQILDELNRAGAGVFFTPNSCDGGRREDNVKCIEWLYVDMDNGTKEEMKAKIKSSPILPHIIVESKRSYHLYWRADCTKEQFYKAIQGLIEFFDGDKAISSTNEVLRLPGYNHMKNPNDPFKIKIIYFDKNRLKHSIRASEIIRWYPSTKTDIKRTREAKKGLLVDVDDKFVYQNIKEIPIHYVLQDLAVEVNRNNFIIENGEVTSASVNVKKNYVNRFSGKEGSGSTIDVAMQYGDMNYKEAVTYLSKLGNVKEINVLLGEKEEEDILAQKGKIFTWGTDGLDEVISPISDDTFVIFAGETGSGKTMFTFDMAIKNSDLGHKVLYISLEMNTKAIFTRVSREFAMITKSQWRDKSLVTEDQKLLFKRKQSELYAKKNLTAIGFQEGVIPSVSNIIELIKKVNPELVFIDNFDLIEHDSGKSSYDNENSISKKLLDTAKHIPKPIILIHHLKKGSDDDLKKPRSINSLKGSGKIVHNADMVVMGFRPPFKEEMTDEERQKFIVLQLKDRDFGIGGYRICYFYRGKFHDKVQSDDQAIKNFNEVFYG